jgi:hypothetical protein
MNLRQLSVRYLESVSQWIMMAGIVALVQPWIDVLHRYGVTITLIGLVGFILFSHIRPGPGD